MLLYTLNLFVKTVEKIKKSLTTEFFHTADFMLWKFQALSICSFEKCRSSINVNASELLYIYIHVYLNLSIFISR